jgi:hypothetical protein
MIGYDTMVNGIPGDMIVNIDKRKLEIKERQFKKHWPDTKPKLEELKPEYLRKIPGLEKLHYDEFENKVIMRYSAKALKSRYLENINANNYYMLFDSLTENEILEVDKTKLLSHAEVYWADVVANLQFPKGVENHLSALKATTARNNLYVKERDNGIEIHSKTASDDFYLKFYIKIAEIIERRWANKEILKYVPKSQFENIIRVELSLKSFEGLRKHLELPEKVPILLKDVIFSGANPLHKAFHKALNIDFANIPSIDPIFTPSGSKMNGDVLKYVGLLYSVAGNIKLCRKMIREHHGVKSSPEYKKLNIASEYFAKIKLGPGLNYIKEIDDKLCAL